MAERSVIAFRYLGTFSNKKRTWATLERLGEYISFAATDYPSVYVSGVVRRLVIDL